ncbi:hypothetical protein ATANTOWER_017055 [Ataeniobius toweri]|uniref:SET domain-containing protein n=1 Tax=Ataeniobius toweri TaxID=208326 RepID=A0ABU7BGS7_9TELE|nr:hypothetical protein [Ataeniobius toweri]
MPTGPGKSCRCRQSEATLRTWAGPPTASPPRTLDSATYSHSGKRPQPDPAHQDQRWPGLTVAESKRPSAGRGLFATKAFSRGEVICDYHGQVVNAVEGRRVLER